MRRHSGFLTKIASFVPDVDFILIAVNYLKLRDIYKDEFTYDENFVSSCKASFGESFTIASYMIGIALGHDKTYACFYESLPLAIYKSKEEMAAILLRKQEERKRAKLEMERIEREREREREFEAKRRKGVKKKGKRIENTALLLNLATVWEEVAILLGGGSQKNHFHHVRKMTQIISLLRWIEDTNMKHQEPKQINVFHRLILLIKLVTSLGMKKFRK